MPFAAFFVAFLLLLCIPDGSRKLAVCLLLGALAGLCAVYTTNAGWSVPGQTTPGAPCC